MWKNWRAWILATLFIAPSLVYMTLGFFWLAERGWAIAAGIAWVFTGALLAFLGDRWTRDRRAVLPPIDWNSPETLGPNDQIAWDIVQDEASRGETLDIDEFSKAQCYLDAAMRLADRLAKHYHDHESNPLESVPIVELLTAIELASEDLGDLVRKVPGADLLTIRHCFVANKAAGWAQRASDLYAYVLPLAQPLAGLARLGAREWLSKPAWRSTSQNVMRRLFEAYVNRLGAHLIELYSGRLAIGAATYRKLRSTVRSPEHAAADHATNPHGIVIRLIGVSIQSASGWIDELRSIAETDLGAIREALAARGMPLDPAVAATIVAARWTETADYPTILDDRTRKMIESTDFMILWIDESTVEPAAAFARMIFESAYNPNDAESRRPNPAMIAVSADLEGAAFNALRAVLPKEIDTIVSVRSDHDVRQTASTILVAMAPAVRRAEHVALVRGVVAFAGRSRGRRLLDRLGAESSKLWQGFRLNRRHRAAEAQSARSIR